MTKTHPALSGTPKTLREALTRALAFAEKAKNYGSCCYQSKNGNTCIIGSFFTSEQRRDIAKRGLNGSSALSLSEKLGSNNIRAMTGMSIEQTRVLQSMFDKRHGKVQLVENLKLILEDGSGTFLGTWLGAISFTDLDKPIAQNAA